MPRRNPRRDPRGSAEPSRRLRTESQREACPTKQRFASEREADDAAYRARMEGTSLGIYRCAWCGGWHLTSLN
jgi:hypothetical protein